MSNKPTVFICKPNHEYRNFMETIGFEVKNSLESYSSIDLLMFTGGTDINPTIYGEERLGTTGTPDEIRDQNEKMMFKKALSAGTPMFGICRGAQLLCCLSGGKLIQHISGHVNGAHRALIHNGIEINVTSSHHQMMHPMLAKSKILATSLHKLSDRYLTAKGEVSVSKEYEAIYFPGTKSLSVQWHPEWADPNEPQAGVVKTWVHNLIKREGV